MQLLFSVMLLFSYSVSAMNSSCLSLMQDSKKPVQFSGPQSLALDIVCFGKPGPLTAQHYLNTTFAHRSGELPLEKLHVHVQNTSPFIYNAAQAYASGSTKGLHFKFVTLPEELRTSIITEIFKGHQRAIAQFNFLPYSQALEGLAETAEMERRYPINEKFIEFGERYLVASQGLIPIYQRIYKNCEAGVCTKITPDEEHLLAQSSDYMKHVLNSISFYCKDKLPLDRQLFKALKDGAWSGLIASAYASWGYALLDIA